MPRLPIVSPEEAGWDPFRLQRAFGRLEQWTRTGELPAACVCVGGRGKVVEPRLFGRQGPAPDAAAVRPDALFLVASITKPVTATAAMMLVERGVLTLDEPVSAIVHGFAQGGKQEVRLRHLLTHTSGLPDMLPNNEALRAAHAPLEAFVDETCRQPLLFPPGSQVRYQSMGFAMLAEVVRRVTGIPLARFLRDEVFGPLGMVDTSLGCLDEARGRVASIRLDPDRPRTDWDWNSPYWLGFGAPWGGLVTSAADFARFCAMMLGGGALDGVRVLAPATVRAMTVNHLATMTQIPEEDRLYRPWGLGWRLNWPGRSANFGDLVGPRAYGHWGATGTLCWLDPDADAFANLFTTRPQGDDGRYLARLSNALAAALA
jgi:CubicO group peptidase (beta-lactamase class C family)